MSGPYHFLYLSRADVEALALPMREVIEAVAAAFEEKAAGRAMMPAKHWIAPSSRRFFSAMSSALPRVGAAGCKWQSGSPDNHAAGRPYITGHYILNDLDSGLPLAIMDSTWLTEMRTAAATAVAARALVHHHPRRFGVLGCGRQARRNLEALRIVFPSLDTVLAYDVAHEAADRFRQEAGASRPVEVSLCSTPREAFAGAEIVLTAGPITPDRAGVAQASWLAKGATCITLDYDCYWREGELARVDTLFTDDVQQLAHTRPDYFLSVPEKVRELAPVVAGTALGRVTPDARIVCINMGLALEDVATAKRIYDRARQTGQGIELPI